MWAAGLWISLAIHLLALLLFQTSRMLSPAAAAGPRAGSPKAAPGGGALTAIMLQPPQPIVVPPRPERVIEPKPVERPPALERAWAVSPIDLRELGHGREVGPETGSGLPGGEGKGDAGDAAEGLLRIIPPDPWNIVPPPLTGIPAEARGREVTVYVFITAAGGVDSVRLAPPTPSREFNEQLVRDAYAWTFKPARRGGRAVAAWYEYTFSLPR